MGLRGRLLRYDVFETSYGDPVTVGAIGLREQQEIHAGMREELASRFFHGLAGALLPAHAAAPRERSAHALAVSLRKSEGLLEIADRERREARAARAARPAAEAEE
jgi:hypothetical protein